jgi:hypothetical protein
MLLLSDLRVFPIASDAAAGSQSSTAGAECASPSSTLVLAAFYGPNERCARKRIVEPVPPRGELTEERQGHEGKRQREHARAEL